MTISTISTKQLCLADILTLPHHAVAHLSMLNALLFVIFLPPCDESHRSMPPL